MAKASILLIDDDSDMISIGEQIFKKAGYRFLSAKNGHEGLVKMLEVKPDIVILDYLLTDMKGSEFIKMVSGNAMYSEILHIPLIILTAWEEDPAKLTELYSRGLKAYLTKPFGHRELKCVVENIIQLSRLQAPCKNEQSDVKVDTEPDGAAVRTDCGILARSIVGVSKMILEGLDGEISERQKTGLTAIYNSGRLIHKKLGFEN